MAETAARGTFNTDLLHQELQALPGMTGTTEEGDNSAHYQVTILVDGIRVNHPDGIDVQNVLDNHINTDRSDNQIALEALNVELEDVRVTLRATGLTDREITLLREL